MDRRTGLALAGRVRPHKGETNKVRCSESGDKASKTPDRENIIYSGWAGGLDRITMLKLDFDRVNKKVVKFLLQSYIMPYWIREGNKGLNFKRECPEDCSGRENCYETVCYLLDDRNRLKLNRQQFERGLSHNILWDIKKGKKKPGEWIYILNSIEADRELRKYTGFGFWVD